MREETKWRALERLAFVPPLLVAFLVWLAGSDVPFWDEWELVDLLAKVKDGTARLGDLFELHGGVHPFALPRAILTAVAAATGWNVRVQLLLNVAIVCATLAMIVFLANRAAPSRARAFAILGSSLAVFSLAQYENWLWGWQVGFFVSIALIVGAIAVLVHDPWPFPVRFTLGALLCAIATFSIGFGAVSWIALVPLVLVARPSPDGRSARRRLPPWPVPVWIALGGACLSAYLLGSPLSAGMMSGRPVAGEVALFFLAVAGTPWTTLAAPAAALGALSIALFAALAWRGARANLKESAPWIAIGLVALGFAALAALARAGSGSGVASRYATPMILVTVATLHLAIRVEPARRRWSIAALLVILLLVANLSFLPLAWSTAAARHVSRVCTDLVFLFGERTTESLPTPFVDARFLSRLRTARDKDLRPFADSTWFSDDGGAQRSEIRVVRSPDGVVLSGRYGRALFPAAVAVTRGADRRPAALVWTARHGEWTARIESEPGEALEVWTIPLHGKRFVRIGSAGQESAESRDRRRAQPSRSDPSVSQRPEVPPQIVR